MCFPPIYHNEPAGLHLKSVESYYWLAEDKLAQPKDDAVFVKSYT